MPYVSTVSAPTVRVEGLGRKVYRWTVTETGAGQANDFVLDGAPPNGTVTLYRAALTAGTGTTINPRLGRANGFALTGNDWIGTNGTSSATINDASSVHYSGLVGAKLYVRSYPNNAAADHSISTEIVIVAGHI